MHIFIYIYVFILVFIYLPQAEDTLLDLLLKNILKFTSKFECKKTCLPDFSFFCRAGMNLQIHRNETFHTCSQVFCKRLRQGWKAMLAVCCPTLLYISTFLLYEMETAKVQSVNTFYWLSIKIINTEYEISFIYLWSNVLSFF